MKKYKGLIIFIIVVLIYAVVLYFVFGNKSVNNKDNNNNNNNNSKALIKENKYLVIGNISNLNYSDGKFYNVKIKEIEKLDLLKTYVNNKYYGDYKFKNGGNWNLFDKSDEYVNYNGSLIAFNEEFNIKVRSNYKVREIEENEKVFLINNYNINSFNNLSSNQVIEYDLDHNDTIDKIIALSSMEESSNIKDYYSILVLILNNEKVTLIEEREKDAKNVYSIYGIINIDNNKKDSIIVTKEEGYISENPIVSNLIYNYKNDKYVID